MKRCRICGDLKPVEEFHRAKDMRDGHRNECKPCFQVLAKRRYKSAEAVARAKQWRLDNPEWSAAYQAEYRNRPERKRAMRDLYYRRTFGITADDVDAMLAAQGGGCAICGWLPPRLGSLHVDHAHASNEIRGLLCINCNQGLGKFGDDPERLERGAAYLRGR